MPCSVLRPFLEVPDGSDAVAVGMAVAASGSLSKIETVRAGRRANLKASRKRLPKWPVLIFRPENSYLAMHDAIEAPCWRLHSFVIAKKARLFAGPFLLLNSEGLDLEIHTAHATHAATTRRHAAAAGVLLRHFGYHGFSGDQERGN